MLERRGVPLYEATGRQFIRLSQTENAQGLLLVVRHASPPLEELEFGEEAVVLALDGVSDPGNVGTLIRTADWFGVSAVLLSKDSVELHNPKVVRATMGSVFRVPTYEVADLAAELTRLRGQGFNIFAAATEGDTSWEAWTAPGRKALVLGSEAVGLSDAIRAVADKTLAIPRTGGGESLNIGIAAGIFLFASSGAIRSRQRSR